MTKYRAFIYCVFVLLLLSVSGTCADAFEGKPAFDFSLQDISNTEKTVTMKDLQGKVVLLNIWASWCTGCRAEMPEFISVKERFGDKGFEIVAVNIDNKKKNALKFLEKLEKNTGHKVNFSVLFDPDKKLAGQYNPPALPASYLIDRNGTIVKVYDASFDDSSRVELEHAIEGMLGEQ